MSLAPSSARGATATFSAYGARLVELRVPDRHGRLENIVLGFDDDEGYRRHANLYFGATIGRVAGRISCASFSLDGRRHELARNEGENHVHGGGERSLDRVQWSAAPVVTDHGSGMASIQLYTANRLPEVTGRDGRTYRAGGAICLEPQRLPDAVNRPEFPSIVLAAGEEYRHVSRYRFYTR